jgi:hypothetical protein
MVKFLLLIALLVANLSGFNNFDNRESIGKMMAVRGEVSILRGSDMVQGENGLPIYNRDEVFTEALSKTQLLFRDGTVITVGQNSRFSIENYLYDRVNPIAETKLHFGILKSITGRIGKIAPQRFKLRTDTSTIGVRGTKFIVKSFNKKDQIACLQGAVTVSSQKGVVDLQAGMFVSTENDNLLPQKLTKKRLQKLTSSLKSQSKSESSSDNSGKRERERGVKNIIDNQKSDIAIDVGVVSGERKDIIYYDPSRF